MNIQATSKDAYLLLHKGLLALARAERQGMRIDVEYCQRKMIHLARKIKHLQSQFMESKLHAIWQRIYEKNVNLQSDPQLTKILYTIMKIKPTKLTDNGQGATDEEALKQLGIPELEKLIEIRKLLKVRNTYLSAFEREQVNGILHPFFNLHTVITYRSSSQSPNFQNIPKKDAYSMKLCRQAIYARPGHYIFSIDYAGIEVRMACIYTEDEKLIYDTLHGDMHKDMAIELYMLNGLDKSHRGEKNLRQGGKNGFVFPEFYGDYYGNCAIGLLKWAEISELKDGTPALAHLANKGLITLNKEGVVKNSDKFIEHVKNVEDMFWNERYRTYNKWKNTWWNTYQKKGYFDMYTGFRCSGVMNKKDACNYPFQGSAFHCLLWSFIRADEVAYAEGWGSKLFGQIHDEMLLDTHPDELKMVSGRIQQIMCKELPEAWDWITVPLEVEADVCEVDRPWSEKKGYELG